MNYVKHLNQKLQSQETLFETKLENAENEHLKEMKAKESIIWLLET